MDHTTEDHSRTSILVVEDHQETRTFLDFALSGQYSVDCAADPDTALKMAEQHTYELFLIDIALHGTIDGAQLAEQLRRHPAYASTPMIAMTAHRMRNQRTRFLERGFDDFLAKPFLPDELLETIERLLAKDPGGPSPRP